MKEGTFVVTHADDDAAVLQDVTTGQVHTLASNPGVDAGSVLDARIEPEPPLEVAWRVDDLRSSRTIPIERSPEPPTQLARELGDEQSPGEITRRDRAGEGAVHVISVPPDRTDEAAADVLDDDETLARAARMDVDRVEVRAADGVVSVRYLP